MVSINTMKKCSKCGEIKNISQFHKDKSRKTGRSEACASCKIKIIALWKVNNAQRLLNAAHNRTDLSIIKNNKKICKKCGEEKFYEYFSRDNRNRDGMGSLCKICSNKRTMEFAAKNKVKKSEWGKRYRAENKNKIAKKLSNYYLLHKQLYKDRSQKWRDEKPEMARAMYKRNGDKKLSTPKGHINATMSCLIRSSLKKNTKANRHWEALVDFTVEQLRQHLERQFTGDMSWSNYGPHWHIDHKIPVSVFNFEFPEDIDFKKCWNLENLQPLEAIKNIKKGARLEKAFQPSLLM